MFNNSQIEQFERNTALDGLRGVAVLLVLFEHLGGTPANYFGFGYYGVDLFFVLSGFLITRVLLKRREQNWASQITIFTRRRLLRILPPYILLVAILYICNAHNVRECWPYLVSFSWNYYCNSVSGPYYLWSLSVEQQFYFVWPLIVIPLSGRRRTLACMCTIICISTFWLLLLDPIEVFSRFKYTGLPTRLSALSAGSLLCCIDFPRFVRNLLDSVFLEFLLGFAILLVLIGLKHPFAKDSSVVVAAGTFCSFMLVAKCNAGRLVSRPFSAVLLNPRTVRLGIVSYGLYLFHGPIGDFWRDCLFGPIWHLIPFETFGRASILRWNSWIISFPCCLLFSIMAAEFSWRFIEQPIIRTRDSTSESKTASR